MKFELAELPFEMDALEPFISRKALEFHHGKCLKEYVKNLNLLTSKTKFQNLDLETIIKVTEGPVFNNASQIWSHAFFFEGLKHGDNQPLKGPFAKVINENFGSVSFFRDNFIKAAVSIFGSGWVWLVSNQKGSLEIVPVSNAGNPLRRGLFPLMVCDVWEHAYFLDYENRRPDYIKAFWKVINWEVIEKRYNKLHES